MKPTKNTVMGDEAIAKQRARSQAKEKEDQLRKKFLKQFEEYTERGTALAVVAYLDVNIENFIRQMWIDDRSATHDMLKIEGGALSSLGSRINICYLSGFLKPRTHKDLKAIKEIRNTFAHKLEANSFSFSKIQDECRKLQIFEDSLAFFGGGEDGQHQLNFYSESGYDLTDHRWGFVAAVGFLANKFQTNQHHVKNLQLNFIKELF